MNGLPLLLSSGQLQIDFVRFLHCNFVLCEYDSMQSKGFSHFAVALSRLNR